MRKNILYLSVLGASVANLIYELHVLDNHIQEGSRPLIPNFLLFLAMGMVVFSSRSVFLENNIGKAVTALSFTLFIAAFLISLGRFV